MKNLLQTKLYRTRILPLSVILLALIFAASVSYAFSSKLFIKGLSLTRTQNQIIVHKPIPSPKIENVLGANIHQSLSTPTIAIKFNSTPTATPTLAPKNVSSAGRLNINTSENAQTANTTSQEVTSPATTTTPTTSPTFTPTPTQANSTVSMQVQTPDGISNFSVNLKNGANVCDVLQEAKDEEKINSVTFDDSYMSSLHSRYVYEINGFKNNWTFTVNGSSPLGCSLSNPKPNDSIVWKFG